jgi:hypothetical protein
VASVRYESLAPGAQKDLEQLLTQLCDSGIRIADVEPYHERISDMYGYLQQLADVAAALPPDMPLQNQQRLSSDFRIIEKIGRAFTQLVSTAEDLQSLSTEQKECISWLADCGNKCIICWISRDPATANMQIRQQVVHAGKCCGAGWYPLHAAAGVHVFRHSTVCLQYNCPAQLLATARRTRRSIAACSCKQMSVATAASNVADTDQCMNLRITSTTCIYCSLHC